MISRRQADPEASPLVMVTWPEGTWEPQPTSKLTQMWSTAWRQDQVIDGHSPSTSGHPLDQHLQGSTMPAGQHRVLHSTEGLCDTAGKGGKLGSHGMGDTQPL